MRSVPRQASVTAVYGGGGVFGIAYGLGVARALVDAGVPLDTCQVLGTSAGSWVASALATGVGYDVLAAQPAVHVPNLRPGFLHGIAVDVFGDRRDARVRACALRLPTPRRPTLRLQLLRGDVYPLADLVAASSSIPGLFSPARIGGGLYVDGGLRSLASAHRAPAADHLVVIAPVSGPLLGAGGRVMELMLAEETRRWVRSRGGEVHVVRPHAAIAALVASPQHLFDKARALDVYPLAYELGTQFIANRPSLLQAAA